MSTTSSDDRTMVIGGAGFLGSHLVDRLLAEGVAVDVVGVTTLVDAGYYPTAGMYLFYGGFCVLGFFAWWRAERRTEPVADPAAGQHSEGALA